MLCLPKSGPIKLAKLDPILLRAKIDVPVITSFGIISERTSLLIRAEDIDGAVGWGEVFGNFPTHGAENRKHILEDYIAILALSKSWKSPLEAFDTITAKTHVLTLQSGEPGPFAQSIAGLDIALWDLAARRVNMPLWKFLGGKCNYISTYASGLNPTGFENIVEQKITEGYNAFKIKVGFCREGDLQSLSKIRKLIGDRRLMIDVNQGWDLATARENWIAYSEHNLDWIEEPLAADRPLSEWKDLALQPGAPIAAGENLLGDEQFNNYINSQCFGFLQPDMCKWGGFSKTLPLARRSLSHGITYCPHFLAGPIGLLASAHSLAAAGGDGLLEIDANFNPIRENLVEGLPSIKNGIMTLNDASGLGIYPDPKFINKYAVT